MSTNTIDRSQVNMPSSQENPAQGLYRFLDSSEALSIMGLQASEIGYSGADYKSKAEAYEQAKNVKKGDIEFKIGLLTYQLDEDLLDENNPSLQSNILSVAARVGLETEGKDYNQVNYDLKRYVSQAGKNYINSNKLSFKNLKFWGKKTRLDQLRSEYLSLNSEIVDLFRSQVDDTKKPGVWDKAKGFTANAGNWASRYVSRFGGDKFWQNKNIQNTLNAVGLANVNQQRYILENIFKDIQSENLINQDPDSGVFNT